VNADFVGNLLLEKVEVQAPRTNMIT
jgi:hypothetical protein